MPTVDADKRNRATATQVSDVDRESTTASDRINRLVREVSKDSENPRVGRNNLTGADGIPGEDGGGSLQPHPQSSASHNRHVPSWIPESVWNRRHPDKPQEDSKSSPTSPSRGDGEHWTKSEEAHSLSPISPVLAKPDPRVRRVIDELEDIDVEGGCAFCESLPPSTSHVLPPRPSKGEPVAVILKENHMIIDFLTRRGAMWHVRYLGRDRPRVDESCANITTLKCNYVCTLR